MSYSAAITPKVYINAQELYDFLKAESVKHKAQGWKYSPPPPLPVKYRKKN